MIFAFCKSALSSVCIDFLLALRYNQTMNSPNSYINKQKGAIIIMKKTLSLILCMCMLAAAFAGCSEKSNDNENGDSTENNATTVQSGAEAETVPEETEDENAGRVSANIPEGTDYEGMKFTVFTYPAGSDIWSDVDWSAEEYTGEGLNDAVYDRITQVEDLLNIDIVTAYGTSRDDINSIINSVKAQDGAYQLATSKIVGVITLASNKYVQELNSFAANGTLDLGAEWWDQNILKDFSIAHKNFALTGDIGTMYKKSIACLMFNKNLLAEHNLEDPYALMRDGKWTIDKAVELGTQVSADLDGNGVRDENDQYGLICFSNMLGSAVLGADVKFMDQDENGIPVDVFYSEKTVSVVEKLATLMFDPNITYSWSRNNKDETVAFSMYKSDKALLYYGEMHAVATMRDMESEFGILPMPKYDEAQESYHHAVNQDVAATYVIPADNIAYESTGYIVDALGAASKNYLTPAYFEKMLKGKVSRDAESQESLEIIFDTIRYDIGLVGDFGYSTMLKGMANSGNTDLASNFARSSKSIIKLSEKAINKIVG